MQRWYRLSIVLLITALLVVSAAYSRVHRRNVELLRYIERHQASDCFAWSQYSGDLEARLSASQDARASAEDARDQAEERLRQAESRLDMIERGVLLPAGTRKAVRQMQAEGTTLAP